MKNRSVATLVFIIISLFASCENPNNTHHFYIDPNETDPTQNNTIYTVTFNANGGSPIPDPQSIIYGGKVTMPPAMTKDGYIFGGWYKEADCINQWNFAYEQVSGNITLYARWNIPITVTGDTLAAKLQWIRANATSNSAYIIEVTSPYEELGNQGLSYSGSSNITIQLKGTGSQSVIVGSFNIGSGVTLILEGNLIGLSVVLANSSSTLIMNQGVKLSSTSSAVYVGSGTFVMNGGEIYNNTIGVGVGSGTFTMNGGEIYDNLTGVSVDSGTFVMNGGEIYDNSRRGVTGSGTFIMYNGEIYGNENGGVNVRSGTFTMNGGKVSGNTSGILDDGSLPSWNIGYVAGGVSVGNGTFTMNGGKVSDNTSVILSSSYSPSISGCYFYGGGVYVGNGIFTMSDGEISGNTCSATSTNSFSSSFSRGGGVYMGSGTFTMSGGKISNNTSSSQISSSCGGGVYMGSGKFIMSGGEISGNTSSATTGFFGGGVFCSGGVYYFEKTGGTIYGYTAGNIKSNVVKNDSNVVQNDRGHAVYIDPYHISYLRTKETTAGPSDNLSYIGSLIPPIYNGAWDN